eukprot:PhM_4_TR11675/c3_g1_i4/m.13383
MSNSKDSIGNMFSSDEARALAEMLDVTNAASKAAMPRTHTQAVGYSLAESETKRTSAEEQVGPGSIGGPKPKLDPLLQDNAPVPSMISEAKRKQIAANSTTTNSDDQNNNNNNNNKIWTDREVEKIDRADQRVAPPYEILYRQKTGVEDAYLGMDFTRDPSTNCSDDVLVKITLSGVRSVRDVEVEVKNQTLTLRSQKYKLVVPISQVVIESRVRAQWDAAKSLLTVTMPVDRDAYKIKVI